MELGAHSSFPLASPTLSRFSLTPEFNYSQPGNARRLNALLLGSHQPFSSGELAASGLLGKIFLHIIQSFIKSSPSLMLELDDFLASQPGQKTANQGLLKALQRFPTTPSFYTPTRSIEYQLGPEGNADLRHSFYTSLILIYTADHNQAFRAKDGIFTDPGLRSNPPFQALISSFQLFFAGQPFLQQQGKSLLDFLLEPLLAHPKSLFDQLEFIRNHWSSYLPPGLLQEILSSLDLLKEEHSAFGWHPGPPQDPLGFVRASYLTDSDQVRFSADQDWMPRVILLAKNVYVWLDQLSKYYQRPIHRLDQIPESEIAKLADWGITALWLIGLWERSPASQRIKQLCGNPDAVPSAYSLYDYTIAAGLGGDEGYQALNNLAYRYGIRLAADMVPNHMGIYSKWVVEHPSWFLSLDQPPFPSYSFTGEDLSLDPSVSIYLEDHYYDKTDAAVVFKRRDRNSNETRFIYHGNDGTSMPWNDTAQLNFLDPAVREAVVQTILDVARKFPIIRFDAAMTLAKKHYQRLWFPQPGTGGAIPTRSEHGMSADQFNQYMPEEFWREVVDRVSQEVPDTLLLAEAFWMMEGYFVRSLGMHRVYNSAFMHMLRDEDNAKYRDLIIQTLEYDPQILKRYVNFMNNPDEETAKSQFGTDGKYFGICTLLATLPGLPMFGHGQIEGLSEKYGMEYRRAYYQETPDQSLIERHRREIFPLLHKRYLFAEVDNFVLYDFIDMGGALNQDVFVFSNRTDRECALVVYHNKWGETAGQIRSSASINGQKLSLLEGLGVSEKDGQFLLYRDQVTGLEYIHSLLELRSHGLHLSLGAYDYHVLLDLKVTRDRDGTYQRLSEHLNHQGVPSLDFERQAMILEPLRKRLVDALKFALPTKLPDRRAKTDPDAYRASTDRLEDLIPADEAAKLRSALKIVRPDIEQGTLAIYQNNVLGRLNSLKEVWSEAPFSTEFLLAPLALLTSLLLDLPQFMIEKQLLVLNDSIPTDFLTEYQDHIENSQKIAAELRLGLKIFRDVQHLPLSLMDLSSYWFSNPNSSAYLGVHYHNDLAWFNKESFESLLQITISIIISCSSWTSPSELSELLSQLESLQILALEAMRLSEYQVSKFQEIINTTI